MRKEENTLLNNKTLLNQLKDKKIKPFSNSHLLTLMTVLVISLSVFSMSEAHAQTYQSSNQGWFANWWSSVFKPSQNSPVAPQTPTINNGLPQSSISSPYPNPNTSPTVNPTPQPQSNSSKPPTLNPVSSTPPMTQPTGDNSFWGKVLNALGGKTVNPSTYTPSNSYPYSAPVLSPSSPTPQPNSPLTVTYGTTGSPNTVSNNPAISPVTSPNNCYSSFASIWSCLTVKH